MTLLLACVFAAGVLLMAARFLWPQPRGTVRRPPRRMPLVRLRLNQAGLASVSSGAFLTASAFVAVLAAAVLQASFGVAALSVAAGIGCGVLPFPLLTARASTRREAGRASWPDTVDQIVSAVRSGLSLPDALGRLSRTGPPATRAAFARFEKDYAIGSNFSHSIDLVKDHLADPVGDRILETLRMARQVGGSDLVGVLRDLAASLRSEASVRSELLARQSWVTSAARLGVAAPWVVLLLLAGRAEGAQAYNSASGIAVILVGLAVCLLAYRVMRAFGRLPEEKRWFG
ncbi:MAG TPA: type II secretion system F family protein [Microbacteriaceae bacterium]|nr:type II secretion system F family protein [Microbacteriaceae bacterium]